MSEGVSSKPPSAGIIGMGICESVGVGKCHLPFKPPSVGSAAPQDPAELLARARGDGSSGASGMKTMGSGSFLPGLPKMIPPHRDTNMSRPSSLISGKETGSEGGRRLACPMSFRVPVLRNSSEVPEPSGVSPIARISINKDTAYTTQLNKDTPPISHISINKDTQPISHISINKDPLPISHISINKDTAPISHISINKDTPPISHISINKDTPPISHISINKDTTPISHISINKDTTPISHISISKDVTQVSRQPSEKDSAPTLRALNPEHPSALPSLGITIQPQLPLIEQHAKMRLQQQKEQPGMHLPVAGFEQSLSSSIRFVEETREKQPLHPIFLDKTASLSTSLPRFEVSLSAQRDQDYLSTAEENRAEGNSVLNLAMSSNDNILAPIQNSLTSARHSNDPPAEHAISTQDDAIAQQALNSSLGNMDVMSKLTENNRNTDASMSTRRESNVPSSLEVLLQPSITWKDMVEDKDDKSNKSDSVTRNSTLQSNMWYVPTQGSSLGVHVAWQDMKGDELFRYQTDHNKSGDEKVNSERLGQLQQRWTFKSLMKYQYIGSARQKQEKWKARVAGGTLFKKNQEKSFIQELFRWHDIGILTLHTLPECSSAPGSDAAKESSCNGTDGEAPEEGETARKRVCLAELRNDPFGGSSGGGGARPANGQGGGERTEQMRGKHLPTSAQKNVCPIASQNLSAHSPSNITGWSIISFERWDVERKKWFTNGNEVTYKQGSFNMCLRHMGFRPTKGARYGGTGYDWDNSVGFVFDPDVKSKYTSKRSRNYSQSR